MGLPGDWERADAEVERLASHLRRDENLRRSVELAAAGLASLPPEWWDTLCGTLAGFPRMFVRDDPELARRRNEAFLAAIDRFSETVAKFEQESGLSLPTANDVVGIEPRHSLNGEVRIYEFLEVIRQCVEREGPAYCHPLIRTPTGQAPRTPTAGAAWLAIRAIEGMGIPHGPQFCAAAAACAAAISSSEVDPDTVAAMLKNRQKAGT